MTPWKTRIAEGASSCLKSKFIYLSVWSPCSYMIMYSSCIAWPGVGAAVAEAVTPQAASTQHPAPSASLSSYKGTRNSIQQMQITDRKLKHCLNEKNQRSMANVESVCVKCQGEEGGWGLPARISCSRCTSCCQRGTRLCCMWRRTCFER